LSEAGALDVDNLLEQLGRDAESGGYHLNPDAKFLRELGEGLAVNTERLGYPLCPCRLSEGSKESDLDIICPCDYRDPDLDEYDTCY
jgi:ferredoxin-thioredoxin reductase catalytic subunit